MVVYTSGQDLSSVANFRFIVVLLAIVLAAVWRHVDFRRLMCRIDAVSDKLETKMDNLHRDMMANLDRMRDQRRNFNGE